jgi:hypothetical protein
MQKKITVRCFLTNEQAISEEFTTLPALSIVMIGFTLFIILLVQTHTAYETRIDLLENYQTADQIAYKLMNPDCYFIREGGLIDLSVLQNNIESLQVICEQYQKSGVTFFLRLRWNNIVEDYPSPLPSASINRIAISKNVGVYLSDAQTVPGTLTIIIWRNPT